MAQAAPGGGWYRICLEGHVGIDWMDWPEEAAIHHTFDHDGARAVTLVTVRLPDPPALYGLLDTFRDLNLKLIYLQRDERA